MVEKCLIAASLAALVCHPSSTIKCFKPKPSTTSPQKEKPKPPPPKVSHPRVKKVPSKSKKDLHANSSSATESNTVIQSPPPPPPLQLPPSTSKTDKLFKAVSELVEEDPSVGIVQTIFRSGWPKEIGLTIEKVLKVNHSANVLDKFVEYRNIVKSNAANSCDSKKIEKLIADGNELRRFQAALLTCSLGTNGYSSICNKKSCGVCRIITSSFSVKDRPIPVYENSWKAHEKLTAGYVANRVCAKKAIILCRVIAGRVACNHQHGIMDVEDGRFDSSVGSTGDQANGSEELLILNPRAVLPCFVVIYQVGYFS